MMLLPNWMFCGRNRLNKLRWRNNWRLDGVLGPMLRLLLLAAGNGRAFLWQNGVMTDLNTLIPAGSPLFLIEATGTINSRGQIAGIALQISTGQIHAFLATPSNTGVGSGNATPAARGETSQSPRVVLPENVRRMLRERMARRYPYRGFGVWPLK